MKEEGAYIYKLSRDQILISETQEQALDSSSYLCEVKDQIEKNEQLNRFSLWMSIGLILQVILKILELSNSIEDA